MADRIQLRRDTAANWTAYNPILLEGEPGIEIDTDQWKLGDGVHTWSQLAYRGGECVQQRGQSTTVAMSQKAVTDELNLIGVFDISAHNLTDGQPTKYADLTAALGTNGANVPTQYRVPGMTVRYVQSSDNKYVQYRCIADSFTTDIAQWQSLDEEIIGLYDYLAPITGLYPQTLDSETIDEGHYYNYNGRQESEQWDCAIFKYEYGKVVVSTVANTAAKIAIYFKGTPSRENYISSEDADYPASYGLLVVEDRELTIPAGTKYIAVNCYHAQEIWQVKMESTGVTKAAIDKNTQDIAEIQKDAYLYKNIKSELSVSSGYYNKLGTLTDNEDWEATIIEISELKTKDILISTVGTSAAPCIEYFSSTPLVASNFISYEPTDYPPNYGILQISKYAPTIPSNAKYIVINNRLQYGKTVVLEKSFPINNCVANYTGKNVLLLGDSITALQKTDQSRAWVEYFNAIVKCANVDRMRSGVDNLAVVGCHWCDYNNNTEYDGNPTSSVLVQNVIGNQVQKIINNRSDYLVDYDLIIISCGTNDTESTGVVTPEEIFDAYYTSEGVKPIANVDRSKWVGITRYAVEKLNGLFPTAPIVFMTPINRIDWTDGYYSRVFHNSEKIRQCAEVNGVLLCDSLHCGIKSFDSSYFVDGLHPSAKGAKLLGEYVANWFINYMNK